jgi:hypothetical protein
LSLQIIDLRDSKSLEIKRETDIGESSLLDFPDRTFVWTFAAECDATHASGAL